MLDVAQLSLRGTRGVIEELVRRTGLSVRVYAAVVQIFACASMAFLADLAQMGLTSSVRLTLAPSIFVGLTFASLTTFPFSTRAAAIAWLGYVAMNAAT